MNIGVIISAFDPINIGHLCMAANALNSGRFNKVYFIVIGGKTSISYDHRIIMCALNIENSKLDILYNDSLKNCKIPIEALPVIRRSFRDFEVICTKEEYIRMAEHKMSPEMYLSNNFYIIKTLSKSMDYVSENIVQLIKDDKEIFPFVTEKVKHFIYKNNLYK